MSKKKRLKKKMNHEQAVSLDNVKHMTVGSVQKMVEKEEKKKEKKANKKDSNKKSALSNEAETIPDSKENTATPVQEVEQNKEESIILTEYIKAHKSDYEGPSWEEGVGEKIVVGEAETLEDATESLSEEDNKFSIDDKYEPELQSEDPQNEDLSNVRDEETTESNKKLQKGLVIGAAALVLGGVGAVGVNVYNDSQTKAKIVQQTNEEKTLKKLLQEVPAFYSDREQRFLLNSKIKSAKSCVSEFDQLKYINPSKEQTQKMEQLKKKINATETVNALFTKPALVDGKMEKDLKLKETTKLPTIQKTGDTTFDALVQKIGDVAKNQFEEAKKDGETQTPTSSTSKSKKKTEEEKLKEKLSKWEMHKQNPTTNNQKDAGKEDAYVKQLSVVPYNSKAIADHENDAWTWGKGIKKDVIELCIQRGYIGYTGNHFNPVNIVNGDGYYNLVNEEGTYIVTVNCKTGWFMGNAKGHTDKLDYNPKTAVFYK